MANKVRRINAAYEKIVSTLINSDGVWQFDDENYSTIPEGTTDLVQGQSDYSISGTFLDILWVKIKNAGGYWQPVYPVDQSQLDRPLEDWLIVNGFPIMYDKVGDTIRLYPAPDQSVTTLTAGMKIGFKRTASTFTTGDTTKVPGFASPFHIILAWMAARPYCMAYKKDRVPQLNELIGDLNPKNPTGMMSDMILHYSNREKDNKKIIMPRNISFR